MDIDKLFKVPAVPVGRVNKRRLPDYPDPTETFKRSKLIEEQSAKQDNHSLRATVEDAPDDDDDDGEDQTSGFAPGSDADYFAEDDEEGRFYGSGLTGEQKEILNLFDNAPDADDNTNEEEQLDISAIRRTLLQFERAVNRNQDQRSKYPNDPAKFIDSEADLDASIKSLLPFPQVASISYPELIRSGSAQFLTGLLTHENVDIVIGVVELIKEFTDEDVNGETHENEDDLDDLDTSTREQELANLVQAFCQHSLLELLSDNLARFNEAEDSDRQGLYNVLGIFENVLGIDPEIAKDVVTKTVLIPWLVQRIRNKLHDDNRSYAAELLSILLHSSPDARSSFGKHNGVERVLEISSVYRKRELLDDDEAEFVDNIFDCLCSCLSSDENRTAFATNEGVELMVLMLKEKSICRARALKVLDYALPAPSGVSNSLTFIEVGGLKPFWANFMGNTKVVPSQILSEDTSHFLGVISALLSNLPSEGMERLRLLAKFVEKNYASVDRVLEIRNAALSKLKITEGDIKRDSEDMDADDASPYSDDANYLRRLDGGLYTVQATDYILAWLIMEDDGIRSHVSQMFSRRSQSLDSISVTLAEQLKNMGNDGRSADEDNVTVDAMSQIIQQLVHYLEGVPQAAY